MSVAKRNANSARVTQPNEFDKKRIERALDSRRRYRYVSPSVVAVSEGYRIESPCCSRNIDPDGGVVDVALLLYDDERGKWQLYCMNHERKAWELHSAYSRLHELLDGLNADPEREFWQ
jgi:hypothetical protein